MNNSTNRLFCRLDGLTPAVREQQRNTTLKSLGLLESGTVPIFDEATQTAARFIEAPICILGLMVQEQLFLKSAVGLSRLGLMNQLAASRQISRQEAFSTYVVDSQQHLIINDTATEPIFAHSILAQHYGIRAYLGTPLITAEGQCIGALAVMDLVPRQFTIRDIEFLALSARWCLREFEREHLLKTQPTQINQWLTHNQASENRALNASSEDEDNNRSNAATTFSTSTNIVKLKLLRQLTHELRTPLTAVIGMASVLVGEVFGSLTTKQKEYLEIIHNSGQHMTSLVDEILKLGVSDENIAKLQLAPVNVEMLCQQALNSLHQVAKQKRQELRLSVEPGKRIWLLDKEKVRQALFFLVISVIESSEPGSEVRIHVSRRSKTLNIAVWVSHPWLGDGLPQIQVYTPAIANNLSLSRETSSTVNASESPDLPLGNQVLSASSLEVTLNGAQQANQSPANKQNQELLGLLLGCQLAESHGGKMMVQGTPESGYRYILMLPKIAAEENVEG